MPRSSNRLFIVIQLLTDEEILNEVWTLSTLIKEIGEAGK